MKKPILHVEVFDDHIKTMINGSTLDIAEATCQAINSIHNAVEDTGYMFRFMLCAILNDPKAKIWDPVPEKLVTRRGGYKVNAAPLQAVMDLLRPEDEEEADMEAEQQIGGSSDETDKD